MKSKETEKLEAELEASKEKDRRLQELCDDVHKRISKAIRCSANIKDIYVNPVKRTVTVKFTNGIAQTATCAEGDVFDPEVGVAIAIASLFCGSKKEFHEICRGKMKVQKNVVPKKEEATKTKKAKSKK